MEDAFIAIVEEARERESKDQRAEVPHEHGLHQLVGG